MNINFNSVCGCLPPANVVVVLQILRSVWPLGRDDVLVSVFAIACGRFLLSFLAMTVCSHGFEFMVLGDEGSTRSVQSVTGNSRLPTMTIYSHGFDFKVMDQWF